MVTLFSFGIFGIAMRQLFSKVSLFSACAVRSWFGCKKGALEDYMFPMVSQFGDSFALQELLAKRAGV